MEPTNCNPGEPFVKLQENGTASILNYQLPQESSYLASGYVSLKIDTALFKQEEVAQTTSPVWTAIEEVKQLDTKGIQQAILNKNHLIIGYPILEKNLKQEALKVGTLSNNTLLQQVKEKTAINKLAISQKKIATSAILSEQVDPARAIQVTAVEPNTKVINLKKEDLLIEAKNFNLNENLIAQQISKGNLPICQTKLSGQNEIKFIQKPRQASPQITLILHFKMSSFLGDYGAGQTIKTVNLLPGESVMATVRSFRHNESVKMQSQNVLDSFSEYSANELQNTVEKISGSASSQNSQSSSSYGYDWNIGGEAGINLGLFSLDFGGSGGQSGNSASSLNSAIQQQTSNLVGAVDTHVSGSNAERNVSINTETMTSSVTETEELITRTYHNPNLSCTNNYVFRQLLQQYISVIFLEDVTVQYYNGFPESRKIVQLSELDILLKSVLIDENAIKQVRNQIYRYLCNIKDYQQQTVGFIEKVDEDLDNCIDPQDPGEHITYIRKKIGLSQTAEGFTVPGIIMNVKKRTLRTDSVVADSLLGQGQALDCYNQHLQSESVKSAELSNAAMEITNQSMTQQNTIALEQWEQDKAKLIQAMEIISLIEDPVEQAKLYKKVFSDCCDVPQVGCSCSGDCHCNDTPTPPIES